MLYKFKLEKPTKSYEQVINKLLTVDVHTVTAEIKKPVIMDGGRTGNHMLMREKDYNQSS